MPRWRWSTSGWQRTAKRQLPDCSSWGFQPAAEARARGQAESLVYKAESADVGRDNRRGRPRHDSPNVRYRTHLSLSGPKLVTELQHPESFKFRRAKTPKKAAIAAAINLLAVHGMSLGLRDRKARERTALGY